MEIDTENVLMIRYTIRYDSVYLTYSKKPAATLLVHLYLPLIHGSKEMRT